MKTEESSLGNKVLILALIKKKTLGSLSGPLTGLPKGILQTIFHSPVFPLQPHKFAIHLKATNLTSKSLYQVICIQLAEAYGQGKSNRRGSIYLSILDALSVYYIYVWVDHLFATRWSRRAGMVILSFHELF